MDIFNSKAEVHARCLVSYNVRSVPLIIDAVDNLYKKYGLDFIKSKNRQDFRGLEVIETLEVSPLSVSKDESYKLITQRLTSPSFIKLVKRYGEAVIVGEQLALWKGNSLGNNIEAAKHFLNEIDREFRGVDSTAVIEIDSYSDRIKSKAFDGLISERKEHAASLFSAIKLAEYNAQIQSFERHVSMSRGK